MIDYISKEDCTGCFACYNVCPKQCLSMEADIEGFVYPKVNYELCIECGMCTKTCPSIHAVDKSDNYINPKIYAAWSLNEEIRMNSTSGGVFSELALRVLNRGGYVCGARYNSKQLVEHYIINNVEGLKEIRQSKYVQSEIGTVFKEIKALLEKKEEVLFCGTPCECAGLINYLHKDYEKLTIVDFICRGANSPRVYSKFLEELEEIYGAKVSRVWFKNKTYGWNKFSTRIDFENGEVYLKDRYSDVYIRGYIEANLYMRTCCSVCKYKTLPRLSDITLGDFWKVELRNHMEDSDRGTSLIMVNSKKGEKIFNDIKENMFLEEKTLEEAKRGNICITTSAQPNPHKQRFLDKLEEISVLDNIKQFLRER